jgi:polar amino acid transport system substrate-binding protein
MMIEDITDKKISEARMLQENKMAAVGQLATGVAHEIRNPLGLIRNYAFVVKKSPNNQHNIQQAIEVIEDSVDKASMIIDNLLNFSRLSNEVVVRVALKPFLEKLIELSEKRLSKNRVICNLILEDLVMDVKEESLKHILINLINNAADAMPHGGNLTIWLYKKGTQARMHIIDTGKGMTKETLSRLYEPFFTTKPVGQGTGLGLYIVFNEIEKMNGKINVISKAGKGTTFKIQLSEDGE